MASLSDYSTAFTAIATIFLVIVTYLLVKATRQLTEVSKRMWMAQDRPFLTFYTKKSAWLGHEDQQCLYVKNVGKGNARYILFNMTVDTKPEDVDIDLLSIGEEREVKQFSETIDVDYLVYKDINGFRYFQDVVIHRH